MFQSYVPAWILDEQVLIGAPPAFLQSLLKDIRSERAKVTEKDNLRLLYVTKWFLEFFLTMRAHATASKDPSSEEKWEFGLIAEVTERTWIVWVLKRMREAMEEKVVPKDCSVPSVLTDLFHVA